MASMHDWDKRHVKKLDWAYEARESLVKDCKNHDIFFFEDHSSESEMMISVYGKSQRGKTTCILSLLGINEEDILTVSDILRGSRKRGTSATSTATAYKKSSSDCFGLAYGESLHLEMDDETFKAKMDEVRSEIENNPRSIDQITIFIPRKYFGSSEKEFKYRIVDLPGIESAEERERDHVEALVDKYFKSSDSVLIVELANSLTDLGHISFARQGLEIWSKRFKVILTRSFSLESVKNMILGQNEEVIYDRLKQYYNEEVHRSLVKKIDKDLEIYPLEFGESLLEFTSTFPEQKESVFKVLRRLKEELLQSISESLTIEDKLIESVYMTNTIQKRVDEKKEERKKVLGNLEKNIRRTEVYLSEDNGVVGSIKFEESVLQNFEEILYTLKKVNYIKEVKNIDRFFNGLIVESEGRCFPIPFNSSVDLGIVLKKTVDTDKLKEDLLKIKEKMREDIHEELYEEVLYPISKTRDTRCENLVKDYEKKHLYSDTFNTYEVDAVVESLFTKRWLKKFLKEDFSDILLDSFEFYYNSYRKKAYAELSELVMKAVEIIRNNIILKQDKIGSMERSEKIKERTLAELRLAKILKGKLYDELIQQYEADAIVVSRFQEYLDQAFKKEYNRTVAQMNQEFSSVWDLMYLKLITDKYQYFTDKLENKYGKTII